MEGTTPRQSLEITVSEFFTYDYNETYITVTIMKPSMYLRSVNYWKCLTRNYCTEEIVTARKHVSCYTCSEVEDIQLLSLETVS